LKTVCNTGCVIKTLDDPAAENLCFHHNIKQFGAALAKSAAPVVFITLKKICLPERI